MTNDGPPLGGCRKSALRCDAVLSVAEVIGKAAQGLHKHHAEIRFGTFLPLGITESREVGERFAETQEILGEVVDRRHVAGQRRARRCCWLAIEIRWAKRFEGEFDAVEEWINRSANEGDRIERKIARSRDVQRQYGMTVSIVRPVASLDGRHANRGDGFPATDGRLSNEPRQSNFVEKMHTSELQSP